MRRAREVVGSALLLFWLTATGAAAEPPSGASAREEREEVGESELPGRTTDPDLIRPPGPRNPASGAPAEWPDFLTEEDLYGFAMIDRLEYGDDDEANTYLWDAQGWVGGDLHKLWLKTEGEGPTNGGGPEDTEFQALYSRTIGPFWDFQAGLRYDANPEPDRGYAVVGIQGLAPYWFETDAALFLSEEGDLSARVELEYELLLTQRLILQPRLEVNASASDVPELDLGSGLNDTEMGLRLRYEIRREFAPYIGVRYERSYGETEDLLEAAGEPSSSTSLVIGIRAWY